MRGIVTGRVTVVVIQYPLYPIVTGRVTVVVAAAFAVTATVIETIAADYDRGCRAMTKFRAMGRGSGKLLEGFV